MQSMSRSDRCRQLPLLLLWMLLLLCSTTAGVQTMCQLTIEGYGDRQGVSQARLGCTGGNISAAADPMLMQHVKGAPGVQWNKDCKPEQYWCLLHVCGGSHAQFVDVTVTGLVLNTTMTTLCLYNSSSIALKGALFSGNQASLINVWHTAALTMVNSTVQQIHLDRGRSVLGIAASGDSSVSVQGCKFINNTHTGGVLSAWGSARMSVIATTVSNNRNPCQTCDGGSTVYAAEKASVSFTQCSFTNNTAPTSGGAIYALGNASVVVNSSALHHNKAGCTELPEGAAASVQPARCAIAGGGAIHATGNAYFSITGCSFTHNTAPLSGGAIFALGNATMAVQSSQLHNNRAACPDPDSQLGLGCMGVGGAVGAADNARLLVQRSTFSDNQATMQGGAVEVGGLGTTTFQGCTFEGNSVAKQGGPQAGGGALLAYGNSTLALSDCLLTNNMALDGGAMVLMDNAVLQIGRNVTAHGNKAFHAGGGLATLSPNFSPQAALRVFVNNTAKKDPNIAVPKDNITLLYPTPSVSLKSRLGASDGIVEAKVRLSGMYNLPGQSEVQALLNGAPFDTVMSGVDGVAHFRLKIQRPPGVFNVTFRPIGDTVSTVVPVYLLVNITVCGLGDVMASSGDACITCVKGSYSMNPENSTCDACPPNAECPGAWHVVPLAGFYSSDELSTQMHRCRNAAACPGHASNACTEGYTSNLCGKCQPGWGTSKPFTCHKCGSKGAIITLYVLAAVAMLVFAKMLCFFTLNNSAPRVGAGATPSKRPAPTDVIKPFLTYLQFMWVVAAMQGVEWPSTLSVPLQALAWLFSSSNPQSLRLQCVLPTTIALPVSVQVFVLSMAMPVLLMMVLLVLESIGAYYRYRRQGAKRSSGVSAFSAECKRLVAQGVIVTFLFYPLLLRAVLGLFSCIPLDRPVSDPYRAAAVGSFWAGDMSQSCWVGYHRPLAVAVGLPLAVVLIVVLPCAILAFLLTNRTALYGDKLRHFSFMFYMYKPSVFYWEVILLLQTAALVSVSVFATSLGSYYAALALSGALALTMVLHAWYKPYANHVAGRTALRGLACVYFTSFASLSFLPGIPYGQSGTNQVYELTAGAVVLLLNVVYIVSVAVHLCKFVEWALLADKVRRLARAATCGSRR